MHQKTGNRYNFLLYLFFLFSLSSINNLSLNKFHNFNLQITNISVTGLDVINNIKITNFEIFHTYNISINYFYRGL